MAIMPRPRGGDWLEDEIKLLQEEGVGILVSALTSEEVEELDLEMESDVCLQYGIAFQPFPISDRDVPSSYHAVHGFVKSLAQDLDAGKAIAIHCRAGIGRSSLLAASVLIVRGFSPTAAFDLIRKARGCNVPDTDLQRLWVERFAQHAQSTSK